MNRGIACTAFIFKGAAVPTIDMHGVLCTWLVDHHEYWPKNLVVRGSRASSAVMEFGASRRQCRPCHLIKNLHWELMQITLGD